MDGIKFSDRAILPSDGAIYGIFAGDSLLYIGMTQNLRIRFLSHHVRLSPDHVIRWIPCESREAREAMEKWLIARHLPPKNRKLYGPGARAKERLNPLFPESPLESDTVIVEEDQIYLAINRARELMGMNVSEFAEHCETSRVTMSNVINGNRPPSAAILAKLGIERVVKFRVEMDTASDLYEALQGRKGSTHGK